jgi:3-oxoacyl-[acyl-carrier-protein] synthase II
MLNGLRGSNNSITAGAVSANLALAEAYRQIDDGEADAVLVGATGSRLSPLGLVHARAEEEIATEGDDPAAVCRPFDRGRSGAVPAEGAAAFVLENAESACRRGAAIYGEVVGVASACAVDMAGRGLCRDAASEALRGCLEEAWWEPGAVGHLHAHGLSARQTDAEEAQAIREVFGSAADRLPVVAAKSSLGDAGAGAGALELAASLLALREGRLFPVLNYEAPDPECPVRPVAATSATAGRSFLKLSLAADGRASCVAVRAWERN